MVISPSLSHLSAADSASSRCRRRAIQTREVLRDEPSWKEEVGEHQLVSAIRGGRPPLRTWLILSVDLPSENELLYLIAWTW